MNANPVSAVFDSPAEAERAVAELRRAGVSDRALSVISQRGEGAGAAAGDHDGDRDEAGSSIVRGILGGGALGAGLGIAALAIPGVGPLVAAGAIATAAVPGALGLGAAAGAVAGSLNETLAGHGVSSEDAGYYDERIRGGGTFVSVDPSEAGMSPSEVEDILHRAGGHNSRRERMANQTY